MARVGMVAWGTITALLAMWILWVVWYGSPEMVGRVKDCATPLGAIVAASALAWSHFYVNVGKDGSATAQQQRDMQDAQTLRDEIEVLKQEMKIQRGRLEGMNERGDTSRVRPNDIVDEIREIVKRSREAVTRLEVIERRLPAHLRGPAIDTSDLIATPSDDERN